VRTLVTGGTGFLGPHLAAALERAGFEVTALDMNPPEPGTPARRGFLHADVRDRAAVRAAAEGCDVVVSNAALVPITRSRPEELWAVNAQGARNVFAAARDTGAYLLHISSSAIFRLPAPMPVTRATPLDPYEPYGRSKAGAERALEEERDRGLVASSLRPRTLVGPGRLGLFDLIFARVRSGGRVPILGSGENRVQLCDVEDFCAAAIAAVRRRAEGNYNLGATEFGTVRADLEALIEHAGTSARLQPVPVWAVRVALAPLMAVGRSPFTELHLHGGESFWFDVEPARRELGWKPHHSNEEALRHAYDDYLRATPSGGAAHRRPLAGVAARLLRGVRRA
jgi:nucleoside-diphosphate-sugar epimerase